MNNYPLRALSKCGNFLVPFTLSDGPCPVDEEHFVLTGKTGSPILRYDTILRGFDIPDLFEGDIVVVEEEGMLFEYIVFYSLGLKLKSLDGLIEKFYDYDGDLKVVSNIYARGLKFIKRNQPKYRVGNSYIIMDNIYGLYDGKLLLNNSEVSIAHPDEFCQLSGVRTAKDKHLYFGDRGLQLHNGKLGWFEGDKFLSFADGQILKEEL